MKLNGFDKYVKFHNKAVSSEDGLLVSIPISSSPYNKAKKFDFNAVTKSEQIETISLETALRSYPEIDLLKMDCEGAEFDILPSLTPMFLDKVNEIRMELHGSLEQLKNCFSYQPFKIISEGEKDLWFIKLIKD